MARKLSKWARRLFGGRKPKSAESALISSPHTIIPRAAHSISRDQISPNALKVLYRLKDAGHAAFLVGGGVRDILLGKNPKDFDVATDAHPEVVRSVFRNSRIIGRRFKLVHVFYGEENIEVSTFRANVIEQTKNKANAETAMIFRDNSYGTIEEDAWRRDFTVNALYYNIADFSIVDFCNGMEDLKNRLIRMIGDPTQRYHEDPVRLLRAIRLSAKLNFSVESKTESTMIELSYLLKHVPPSRLFDEFSKLFFEGNAVVTYEKLRHYGYLNVLFPQMMDALQEHKHDMHEKMIQLMLKATDTRFVAKESINPAFLLSVFLWPALQKRIHHIKNKKDKFYMKLHHAIDEMLKAQLETIMIPKRLQFAMQAIWILQFQLQKRRPSRVMTIFQHRYFRAAFDFMVLRVQCGEITSEIVDWWKEFQFSDEKTQEKMIANL